MGTAGAPEGVEASLELTPALAAAALSREDCGIIPRAIDEMFELIKVASAHCFVCSTNCFAQAREATHDFELKVTFLEIHTDAVNDLLNPTPPGV